MERQELLKNVKALREDGKTIRNIASELGMHRSSVHRALKALANGGARENPLIKVGVRELEGPQLVHSPTDGAFVGRGPEMEQLSSALQESMSGRPHMMMLVGEPGIGKTRITQELAGYAQSRGARVLRGRCYESMGTPPYWPWVQAILSYVRDCDPEHLRSEMGAGAADIAEVVPDLRTKLTGLEPSAGLDPEQARMRLFDSIVTFLKAAAQARPMVLVLDNLHWADMSSLLLLEFMSQELGEARILTIGTYRDTEVSREHALYRTLGELTKMPHFQRIPLSGLTREDVGTLIELVGGIAPSQSLTEQVHQRTGGNPLFVTEVVRLLAPEGALTADEGRGGSRTAPTGIEREPWTVRIPDGVREAIGTRLYRMSEECNRALTVASVVGREFGLELLKRLIPEITEDRLLEALDEALAARVIEEIPGALGRYQFGHALIQETLYRELSYARRARLHASIAETLEDMYGDDAADHSAELVHHFSRAEPVLGSEKLVRYSLLAGERALASFAYEEALGHFALALSAKEAQEMSGERAALLFGLGRAQAATRGRYQFDEFLPTFRAAFDFYAQSGEVDRAVAVAEYPIRAAFGVAVGAAELTSSALELVPPGSHPAGRLLSTHGLTLYEETGDYEGAQQAFDRALAIAQREDDVTLQLRTLANAADVDFYHFRFQECISKGLRAMDLAKMVDDPRAEIIASSFTACALFFIGEVQQAKQIAAAALPAAERLRDQPMLGLALWITGMIEKLEGNSQAALLLFQRGLRLIPRDRRLRCSASVIEHEAGEVAEGAAHLDRLVADTRGSPFGSVFA